MTPIALATGSLSLRRGRQAWSRVAPPIFLGAIPVAAVVLMFVVAHQTDSVAADFHNEIYPEAKEILAGRNPYPPPSSDLTGGGIFVWPPLVALLAAPLTILPAGAADVVMATFGLACFAAALWLVGVRDWRVYGAAALWPSVLGEVRTAHLSLVLCLLVALAWRLRERAAAPGLMVAGAVALKFFLWPLVLWLAARRRYREAGLAAVLAGSSLLLVVPFTSLSNYAGLIRNLGSTFDQDSYSPFGLFVQSGVPGVVARVVALSTGLAVLALAWRRRSLALSVAAALLLSPIVWLDYYAVLAIPLAVVRPTYGTIWLLPVGTWGMASAGLGIGDTAHTVRVLLMFGVLLGYAVAAESSRRRTRPEPGMTGLRGVTPRAR